VIGRIVVAMLALAATSASAQLETKTSQRTQPPPEARYEILQSDFGARFTFRIDRFTGETSQLVLQDDSTLTWQAIQKLPHPLTDTTIPGRANYQAFTSGIGPRYTFLINVNTGATWQLSEDPNQGIFWLPLHAKTQRAPN